MDITASPEDHISPKTISPPAYTTLATVPSTSTPVITSPPASYPAVLVGRPSSSLSEPKPKVPPPVPPRGTPKPQRNNGKGADLLYTNGNLLHDLLCLSINSDSLYSSEGFVTSIDESDNLNRIDDYSNFSKSLEFNQNYLSSTKRLKRSDKSFDLNLRSNSVREKSPDLFDLSRHKTLPRNYKRNVNQEKFSQLHNVDYITKSERKENLSQFHDVNYTTKSEKLSQFHDYINKTEAKEKFSQLHDVNYITKSDKSVSERKEYGVKVKSLKSVFDKSESPKVNPKVGAYFIGTSSYLDERKRYENVPRIIISSSDQTCLPNVLSPQRSYVEVYNSKSPRTSRCFDESFKDLGDLV